MSLMTHLAGNYLNAGMKAERWGTGHQSIVPYQVWWVGGWVWWMGGWWLVGVVFCGGWVWYESV